MTTPERPQSRRSGVFITKLENIPLIFLVSFEQVKINSISAIAISGQCYISILLEYFYSQKMALLIKFAQ